MGIHYQKSFVFLEAKRDVFRQQKLKDCYNKTSQLQMPPRTPIRDRYAILALKARGLKICEIAKTLNMRYQTVQTWYNRETTNDKPRMRKYVSEREVRAMGRDLRGVAKCLSPI